MQQMVFPDETGFVRGLYEMSWMPGALREQFERLFLSPVDSQAADALSMMERGEPAWTTDLRSAWTRFILTLLLRMPEDVIALKGLAESYLIHGDNIEIKYRQLRSNDDPASWTKWLETNAPNVIESAKFRIAQSLMNHEKIGTDINNLTWSLVNTNQCRFEMLTSDRPVTMSSNMALEDAFILVPVGPRRFFLACRKGPSIDAKVAESVVTNSNKYVVTRAVKFVYGTSPSARRYVEKNMGIVRDERILERLLRNRKNTIK